MKKITSIFLAFVFIVLTAFSTETVAFAKVDTKAIPINLDSSVNLSLSESKDGKSYDTWVSYTADADGDYQFESSYIGRENAYLIIAFYDGPNTDTTMEYVGYIDTEKYQAPVLTLQAGHTYYIHLSVEMSVGKSISIPFVVRKHTHNIKSYCYPAWTSYEDGERGKECTICRYETDIEVIPCPTKFKLSSTRFVYDKKTHKPALTIKDRTGRVFKEGTDYTLTYPSSPKAIGKYSVTVKFKGDYSGVEKVDYYITPKTTSLTKLSPYKKKIVVKWKKQTSLTNGYQIQYSTDKEFKKSAKTVTVSNSKTTSKTLTKLKSKKRYYVRVRTYKNVKGSKVCSKWSKPKSIKTN